MPPRRHSYWIDAAIFAVAAVLCGLLVLMLAGA